MSLDINSLQLVDTVTLHNELRRLVAMTAETLREAALVYAELLSRGESCPYLPNSIAQALRCVADGVLEPEAALAFGRSAVKVRLVSTLPLEQQKALAGGAPVVVVSVRGNGDFRKESVPGTWLTTKQLKQVVVDGQILSAQSQVSDLLGAEGAQRDGGAGETMRQITVRLPADLLLAIQRSADAKKILVSEVIVELLTRAMAHPRMRALSGDPRFKEAKAKQAERMKAAIFGARA